ncbi:RtcB family protein [Chryseolinea lacunae]|uniref:3'-phosphate/5'-hydroxy nucleic acid ligase n=1 Tax=Chryseolinea lacunae TaxID=2801331 RepID=A0ABS1KRV3_9BACT|nr:RtcB family protein [Chryseolinea lacunae]MBL0742043.1 RtcB family protein [Chryseolinea lacunae]
MKITGKELMEIGYAEGKALGVALTLLEKEYAGTQQSEQLTILKDVLANPEAYAGHAKLSALAKELLTPVDDTIALLPEGKPYTTYGAEAIEQGAKDQMNVAVKLPVAVAGALMPDAHQGYGLPIGGVLATRNAVIPYGVGVDIGCRMCLTLYDLPVSMLDENKTALKKMLMNNTMFGTATFKYTKDHEIFARKEFEDIRIVKDLKDRAWKQIGSSGGGNHFVEFGEVNITSAINQFNVNPGRYLALLSHSGSRGLGATIAGHYTRIAMDVCKLPQEAKHLAWLDLDTEAGQEYWLAMNLAGDYASACHHQIHERMAVGLRATPLAMIENHHNFAWKEKDADGNEVIVHRKGATPAGKGVLGIIPGSMATPGFIVMGKGVSTSINSASHGAGRLMSRTKAKQSILQGQVDAMLKDAGVELIGAGLDEAPMAYKNIHEVMKSQEELVEVMGTFMPKIVRMCGDKKFQEAD